MNRPADSLELVALEVIESTRDYLRTTNALDCRRMARAVDRLEAFMSAPSAAPAGVEAVRALPAKWRVTSHQAGQGSAGNKARRRCADELERALADVWTATSGTSTGSLLSAAPAGEEPEFDFHDTGDDYCRQCGCAYTYAAAPTPEGSPLTAAMLADALGCFWNAGIGAENVRYDSTARAIVGGIAEGLAAVEVRLRELANPQQEGGR